MDPVGTIQDLDQFSALADEHRRDILRRLMHGESTISRLGREFGRHPAWIRHHVKRLEALGLVEMTEERTTRNYTEKFYRASAGAYAVHLLIGPDPGRRDSVLFLGSHDFAVELLAQMCEESASAPLLVPAAVGSLDGLIALQQGLPDIAGCHLFDPVAGEYNIPFIAHLFLDRPVVGVTLAHREQGLFTAPGNPLGLASPADLARDGIRLANRNAGSGTRVWLDRSLASHGIAPATVPGYDEPLRTHTDVADAIASGRADLGVGVRAAAERFDLGFVPLYHERYDLVVYRDRLEDERIAAILEVVRSEAFKESVGRLVGYDATHTGEELALAG